jgi:hypothetical protein
MCVFKYHAFIYFLHPPPPWSGTLPISPRRLKRNHETCAVANTYLLGLSCRVVPCLPRPRFWSSPIHAKAWGLECSLACLAGCRYFLNLGLGGVGPKSLLLFLIFKVLNSLAEIGLNWHNVTDYMYVLHMYRTAEWKLRAIIPPPLCPWLQPPIYQHSSSLIYEGERDTMNQIFYTKRDKTIKCCILKMMSTWKHSRGIF